MQEQYLDRVLKCADCHGDFTFTAGEQLFFFDKQFKNDPKRCKPCKSRRSGLAAVANGLEEKVSSAPRVETRTLCSDCGIETTVPFKPTQGRPVLCRQCFGNKIKLLSIPGESDTSTPDSMTVEAQADTLAELSIEASGAMLSESAALLAATSMALAHAQSSVANGADLAAAAGLEEDLSAELQGETAEDLMRTLDALTAEQMTRLTEGSLPV